MLNLVQQRHCCVSDEQQIKSDSFNGDALCLNQIDLHQSMNLSR